MTAAVRGAVFTVELTVKARGGQRIKHFVIVVQDDRITNATTDVLIVPVSSEWTGKTGTKPVVIPITKKANGFLSYDSVVLCHRLAAVAKSDLTPKQYAGKLDAADLARIETALLRLLGIAG